MTGKVAEMRQERPQVAKQTTRSIVGIKKTCRQCGKAITAKWQKTYCSQECRVMSTRACARKRRAANPEKAREMSRLWNKNNPEKINEAGRRYYKNNKEKVKEASKRYYKNNAEKVHARNRQRRKDNLEKAREYSRRRDAKRRKIIKDNTDRWVENYMAKVREGARIEREAEGKNTGDGRPPHMVGGIQMWDESV